ncbi:MAG: family N-acetyltransferase [Frankiales bacterium]|nr:family N-acetyltransferase [Frankiales bacterium]
MDALARQRSATVAVWRADVLTRPGGSWADLGGLAVHTTGLPVPYWNGAHVTDPSGLRALPEARRWFEERGMPWGVLVPAELELDPGTPHVTDQRVMLRDLSRLPAMPLRPEVELWWGSEDAVGIQAEAFEEERAAEFVLPKLVNDACAVVVAHDEGVAAATATLVTVEGVAAIYGVATVASHRRKGLGRAVTLAALHEGERRGCDLAFLNPSDLGYGVYAELGFVDAPPWRVYSAPMAAVREEA